MFCAWTCRKAVASAFSTANMKAQFGNIRTSCAQLVTVLKTLPRGEVVDMDSALCRESLDVIGVFLPTWLLLICCSLPPCLKQLDHVR